MTAPTSKLLEVVGLSKHFRVAQGPVAGAKQVLRAVDGVSFEICSGRGPGLVGESGSGKSHVVRAALRLCD